MSQQPQKRARKPAAQPDAKPEPQTKPEEKEQATSRQIIPTVKGTSLEVYQEREIMLELVDRLMAFHPAARDVGKTGMLMVAQLALLMGASPLPSTNEIHVWVDNKNNVNISPGINYWRRRAEQKGGVWWVVRPRPMNSDERRHYGIPDTLEAAICVGARARMVNMYCVQAKQPLQAVLDGQSVIGIGSVLKTEYAKSGRPLVWSAIKRAETDLLKQLFPYIPGEKLGSAGMGMVVDHETGNYVPDYRSIAWGELDHTLHDISQEEGREFTLAEINSDLFGDDYTEVVEEDYDIENLVQTDDE